MKLSKLIPSQKDIPYLGAFIDIVLRVFGIIAIVQFVLNTRVQYYNVGDTWIKEIFPSYTTFILFYAAIGVVAMFVYFKYILPSQQRFNAEQSPMYTEILEIKKQLELLNKQK